MSAAGRILELLYCQTCGELFLGGYRHVSDEDDQTWFLYPEIPDLESIPNRAKTDKYYANYALYWPSTKTPLTPTSGLSWTRERNAFHFQFKKAYLEPQAAKVNLGRRGEQPFTGWAYLVKADAEREEELQKLTPFPIICPRCGDNREGPRLIDGNELPINHPRRTNSPIGYQVTGFAKINQVLADALIRQLPEDTRSRKLILFSDSRQDAAKLSAGIEQGHYLDLIRQIVSRIPAQAGTDVRAYLKMVQQQPLTNEEVRLVDQFEEAYPDEALAIERVAQNRSNERQRHLAETRPRLALMRRFPLCRMCAAVLNASC